MKKIAFGLLVLLGNVSLAQENTDVKKETKFQVGVHYVGNLRNENIISDGFNGIVGISANYAIYQNEMISIFGGLNIDYLQSRDLFLQNEKRNYKNTFRLYKNRRRRKWNFYNSNNESRK